MPAALRCRPRSPCRPSRSGSPTSRRLGPGRPARKAARSMSRLRCRAPALMRCRVKTSSRAWQLAVEHINNGDPLIKKIAPKVTKGLLGKKVKLVVGRLGRQAEPGGAGAPDLHQPEQDHPDDRLDVERGGRRAQQVRAAREGALRHRASPGQQRHDRQGLRALRLPPEFLRRDRGQRDRPGAGQGLRQEQEGGVHDAGLHLRPHRHQVGERLSDEERRLDAGDQPGLAARHAGLQPVSHQHRQFRRRVHRQRELGPRRGAVDPAGQAVRPDAEDDSW